MRRIHIRHRFVPLLPILGLPDEASAQIAGSDAATVTSSAADWGGVVVLVTLVVVFVAIIGVGAKLYDAKRKREGDALILQARVSDALLSEFAALPITAVATGSRWRRTPLVLAIKGSVPTPELREAVMRSASQELSRHPGVLVEDQLFVDPMAGKVTATRSS